MSKISRIFAFSIILSICLFTNTKRAFAQPVVLGVELLEVVALVMTDLAPQLVHATADNYQNGVTYTPLGGVSGTVSSTINDWDLTVAASGDLTGTLVPANTIPIGSVTVTPSDVDGTPTLTAVPLSTSTQTIIDEAESGLLKPFTLSYSTQGNDPNIVGQPTDVYVATLTYTAVVD